MTRYAVEVMLEVAVGEQDVDTVEHADRHIHLGIDGECRHVVDDPFNLRGVTCRHLACEIDHGLADVQPVRT